MTMMNSYTIGKPHFGKDDDLPLGIRLPATKPPAPVATAKAVAPKVTASPEAVANVIYEQPVPCLVPTTTLKRHDKIELLTGRFSKVGKVVGNVIFLDGGLSISAKNVPTVMLVYRATVEESEGVVTAPQRKPVFPKATEPKCPSSPPRPVPGLGIPEPSKPEPTPTVETPTLIEAAEKMVGGRPVNKLVNPVPGTQVIIFAGEDKDLSKYHLAPFASDEEKQAMQAKVFGAMRNGEITYQEANDIFDRNIHHRILLEDQLMQSAQEQNTCLALINS